MLLEDLLEQEKREQARHTNVANPMEGSAQNQSLLSDQVNYFELFFEPNE